MNDTSRPPPHVRVDARILTEFGPRIGPHALAVYLALARFADNTTRTCFPSVPTVARLTGMSRPTATKALRTLEGAGLIAIRRRRTEKGDPSSHEYKLLRLAEGGIDSLPGVCNGVEEGGKNPLQGVANDVEEGAKGAFHELNSINKSQGNYSGFGAAAPYLSSDSAPQPGPAPVKTKRATPARTKGEAAAPRAPTVHSRDPNLDHPAVRAYREHCKATPNETQRAEIAATIGDTARWEEVMVQWLLAGYCKNSVAGMLDWYRDGIPERSHGYGGMRGDKEFGLRAGANERYKCKPQETPEERERLDAEWPALGQLASAAGRRDISLPEND